MSQYTPTYPRSSVDDMVSMLYQRMVFLDNIVAEFKVDLSAMKHELSLMKTRLISGPIAMTTKIFEPLNGEIESATYGDGEVATSSHEMNLDRHVEIPTTPFDTVQNIGSNGDCLISTTSVFSVSAQGNTVVNVTMTDNVSETNPQTQHLTSPASMHINQKRICTTFAILGDCDNESCGRHRLKECEKADLERISRCVNWNCGSPCSPNCQALNACFKCGNTEHPSIICGYSISSSGSDSSEREEGEMSDSTPTNQTKATTVLPSRPLCKHFNYQQLTAGKPCYEDICKWEHRCLSCGNRHPLQLCPTIPKYSNDYCSFFNCFGNCKRPKCPYKHTCLMCQTEGHGSFDCPRMKTT
ncbi:hypothetical protein BCR33DRAFT_770479 [Rhizoclosmatium globosum]|uniref:C3H1-type domain-containing protein n=1 Tax=Rhizoclosmatium globosum TaxID=329046 RepID=A0A1Y2BMT7_9FUNG|nr:hypothetical protein BCR33DRAFT_770479 [Rhizoclosmatium globosum]|eukprot:ORY36053.1 hypothetical protein BCR33DRAFT_770479 [Rhizoclosmatium globosum]